LRRFGQAAEAKPRASGGLQGLANDTECASVGANGFSPGRPKKNCTPPGGSEVHTVTSVGAIYFRL
jgi:hypothetical protein